jgi:hypothetical protein
MRRAAGSLVVDGRSGLCVGAQLQAPCARGAQRWPAASPLSVRRESGRWHSTDDFAQYLRTY